MTVRRLTPPSGALAELLEREADAGIDVFAPSRTVPGPSAQPPQPIEIPPPDWISDPIHG